MTAGRDGGRLAAFPAIGAATTWSYSGEPRNAAGTIRSGAAFFVHLLKRRPMFAAGYVIVLAVVLLAVFAPWIAPHDPKAIDMMAMTPPVMYRNQGYCWMTCAASCTWGGAGVTVEFTSSRATSKDDPSCLK